MRTLCLQKGSRVWNWNSHGNFSFWGKRCPSSSLPSLYTPELESYGWNIPLADLGPLAWLCPLPGSCPLPSPLIGEGMAEGQRCWAVARTPLCYQHPSSYQCKAQPWKARELSLRQTQHTGLELPAAQVTLCQPRSLDLVSPQADTKCFCCSPFCTNPQRAGIFPSLVSPLCCIPKEAAAPPDEHGELHGCLSAPLPA